MSIGEMTVGDRQFPIASASIGANMFMADGKLGISWGINIQAKKPAVGGNDPRYPALWDNPNAYANDLQISIRSWKELQGMTLRVEDQQGTHIKYVGHDPMVRLYVCGHELLLENEIQFGRRDGNQFEMTWLAKTADLQLREDDYDVQYPFKACCPITFGGIEAGANVDPPDSDELDMERIAADLAGLMELSDLLPPIDATPPHWRQLGMRRVHFRPA